MELTNSTANSDFEVGIIISPIDLIDYFSNGKRPIREGTELLNAGRMHAVGIVPPASYERVMGLVVQTSGIKSNPHEVRLENLRKTSNLWRCICSCKAGIGEKCKHIAACLLHIRYPNLYSLSSTDLKQKWGKIGQTLSKTYNSVDTTEMCHVRRKQLFMHDDTITEEQQDKAFDRFLKGKHLT